MRVAPLSAVRISCPVFLFSLNREVDDIAFLAAISRHIWLQRTLANLHAVIDAGNGRCQLTQGVARVVKAETVRDS